jgi:hypothetical protein
MRHRETGRIKGRGSDIKSSSWKDRLLPRGNEGQSMTFLLPRRCNTKHIFAKLASPPFQAREVHTGPACIDAGTRESLLVHNPLAGRKYSISSNRGLLSLGWMVRPRRHHRRARRNLTDHLILMQPSRRVMPKQKHHTPRRSSRRHRKRGNNESARNCLYGNAQRSEARMPMPNVLAA